MPRLRFVLPAALVLVAGAALLAQQPGGDGREQELEAIRGEIAELTAHLERVRESAAGIEGELDRIELELELQSRKVEEASAAKAIAEERAAAAERAIADLEARFDAERMRLEMLASETASPCQTAATISSLVTIWSRFRTR